jgi:hypothetical protein
MSSLSNREVDHLISSRLSTADRATRAHIRDSHARLAVEKPRAASVAGAVLSLLSDGRHRRGAATVSATIAEMAEPREALKKLLKLVR